VRFLIKLIQSLTPFSLCLCVFHPAFSRAGVRRNDVPDSQYLALANAEPVFEAVGQLAWSESGGGFFGSGTLITDQWVLTAAHNIDGSNGAGAGISNLRFTAGSSTFNAAQWIAHPNWFAAGGESNLFSGWDIGLVRLENPSAAITPAEIFTGSNELGQVGTIVGYGLTGVGAAIPASSVPAGAQPGTGGTLRAGQNVVDVVGGVQTVGSNPNFAFGHNRILAVDFDNPTNIADSTLGSSSPLGLEYLTAPGDSGGGLFLESDGFLQLAGVTSFGSTLDGNINSDYGDRGSYTRVSQFVDWIANTISTNTPTLAGDFNADDVVNGLDFLAWQRGESNFPLSPSDLTDFQTNYGSPNTSLAITVSSIPEPTSVCLVLTAIFSWLVAESLVCRVRVAKRSAPF